MFRGEVFKAVRSSGAQEQKIVSRVIHGLSDDGFDFGSRKVRKRILRVSLPRLSLDLIRIILSYEKLISMTDIRSFLQRQGLQRYNEISYVILRECYPTTTELTAMSE